ncbi:arginine deiminase family protein [Flavobacteriales bacterium]|nr:arginine deiminase family protein [Flavobacteriales bacterium]
MSKDIQVSSEVGKLKRMIIHSPDAGIGKIAPRMQEDLLYDDIVYLDKMREEYREYLKVLLWFLDPGKLKDYSGDNPNFFKPSKSGFFDSDKVMDVETLLMKILMKEEVKKLIVASICSLEKCDFKTQARLIRMEAGELARTLITGCIDSGENEEYLFPPIPNLIFTRDICIVVNDHIILIKPAEKGRAREAQLIKYIAYFSLFGNEANLDNFSFTDKIIELNNNEYYFLTDSLGQEEAKVSIEGGDVMMISPRHLVVGLSARTTQNAIDQLIHELFTRKVVDKVSVVNIPDERAYMHIDTIFTMVRRDLWVMYAPFSKQAINADSEEFDFRRVLNPDKQTPEEKVNAMSFSREDSADGFTVSHQKFDYLEGLLLDISKNDFGCKNPEVMPNAGGKFPHTEREQWTDACNFLAIQEGVIIGYDRNVETTKSLVEKGFSAIRAEDFNKQMAAGASISELIKGDTLILLSSSELSRARGGTHCMSMPLLREEI